MFFLEHSVEVQLTLVIMVCGCAKCEIGLVAKIATLSHSVGSVQDAP